MSNIKTTYISCICNMRDIKSITDLCIKVCTNKGTYLVYSRCKHEENNHNVSFIMSEKCNNVMMRLYERVLITLSREYYKN